MVWVMGRESGNALETVRMQRPSDRLFRHRDRTVRILGTIKERPANAALEQLALQRGELPDMIEVRPKRCRGESAGGNSHSILQIAGPMLRTEKNADRGSA